MPRTTLSIPPVQNTSQLVSYVARQFPEMGRQRVEAVIRLALLTVTESLLAQAADHEAQPRVQLLGFGTVVARPAAPRMGYDFQQDRSAPIGQRFSLRWNPAATVQAAFRDLAIRLDRSATRKTARQKTTRKAVSRKGVAQKGAARKGVARKGVARKGVKKRTR